MMLDLIRNRRSIRQFSAETIDDEAVNQIIEMGTWAPSGLNNQPWKFVIVRDFETRKHLSGHTRYSRVLQNAPVCIAVFLDNKKSYDRVKDIQAIGACIQNMLLTVHHMGLGAVWLGEILKNRQAVEKLLGVPDGCELMAVVALGRPAETRGAGSRKPLSEVIIGRK